MTNNQNNFREILNTKRNIKAFNQIFLEINFKDKDDNFTLMKAFQLCRVETIFLNNIKYFTTTRSYCYFIYLSPHFKSDILNFDGRFLNILQFVVFDVLKVL